MNTYSIILFYKYVSLSVKEIGSWQKKLCTQLHLKGRIIIAPEGINGTVAGKSDAIQEYMRQMNLHSSLQGIDFKESSTGAMCFPRLRIHYRKEIVNLGIDPELLPAAQAAPYLDPAQAHALITQRPENLLILDCRNTFESEIGRMEGALRTPVAHFRDFPAYIDANSHLFKDKKVIMYCTGGVRCERASAYIQNKNIAESVYHIKGGIHRYIEQFPNGFFKGKNYVFDGRTAVPVTADILSTCQICMTPADDYNNCLRAACNKHFISCSACLTQYTNTCSLNCYTLITLHNAPKRPFPTKVYPDHEYSSNS